MIRGCDGNRARTGTTQARHSASANRAFSPESPSLPSSPMSIGTTSKPTSPQRLDNVRDRVLVACLYGPTINQPPPHNTATRASRPPHHFPLYVVAIMYAVCSAPRMLGARNERDEEACALSSSWLPVMRSAQVVCGAAAFVPPILRS